EPVSAAASPSPFNDDVLTFDVAQLAQPLPESVRGGRTTRHGCSEERDPRHLPRSLCLHSERGDDGAGQRGQHEAAAVHAEMVGRPGPEGQGWPGDAPPMSASAFSSQYVMPISRYIVTAVARCSRCWSLPRPRWQ